MQHEGRRVNVRRRPSGRRDDASFTCFHVMTLCSILALRFRPHPAILGVRELFGVSLTSPTFLAEYCFMKKISPTAAPVRNGCLVYDHHAPNPAVLFHTPSS